MTAKQKEQVTHISEGIQKVFVGVAVSLVVWFVVFFKDVPTRQEVEQMIDKRYENMDVDISKNQKLLEEILRRLIEAETTLKLTREYHGKEKEH